MLLTPLLLRAAPQMAARLHRKPNQEAQIEEISALNAGLDQHVVICGYGRVGQSIGRFMRNANQPYIALDNDPVRVQEAAAGESEVHYGDSARGDLLTAVGLLRPAAGDRRGSERCQPADSQGSAPAQCADTDSGAHPRRQPMG
jgi:CPA2 family monovalent cation:H+ antiporter-2